MRFDIQNQLCRAQAFTGAATVSDYAYKKQSAAQDLSIGRLMCVVVFPTVAAGGGSTHTWEVVQAANKDLNSGLEVIATAVVLAANMTVGDKVVIPIPQGSMSKQYIGLRNTSTGGTTTVTADAYLMPLDEVDAFKSFPKVVDAAV